jgi:hypothetical protein
MHIGGQIPWLLAEDGMLFSTQMIGHKETSRVMFRKSAQVRWIPGVETIGMVDNCWTRAVPDFSDVPKIPSLALNPRFLDDVDE